MMAFIIWSLFLNKLLILFDLTTLHLCHILNYGLSTELSTIN